MNKDDKYSFFIGLFSFIPLRIIGLAYVSEVFLFLIFFFVSKNYFKTLKKIDFKAIGYLILWFIGCVFASYYNNTSQLDFFKGTFTIISLIIIYISLNNYKNLSPSFYLYFILGQFFSILILNMFFNNLLLLDNIENNGLMFGFLKTFFIISFPLGLYLMSKYYSTKEKRKFYILLLIYSFGALIIGSRNQFLVFSIVFVLFYFNYKRINAKMIIPFLISLLVIYQIYYQLASSNYLGEYAYSKLVNQANSRIGIFSGRATLIESLLAIYENPIIGYGPYSFDYTDIKVRVYNFIYNKNISASEYLYYNPSSMDQHYVPRHSYILGAWVFSGILSVPFWVFYTRQVYKSIIYALKYTNKYKFLVITCAIFMLWNIFFSPLANRINLIMFLMFIYSLKNIK